MRLEEFIGVHRKSFGSEAEAKCLQDIIFPVIGDEGLDHCIPQYEVISEDQRKYKIDFALVSAKNRIALEVEGYSYHGEGKVSEKEFIRQTERQNYLQSVGWKVVRLAYGQIVRDPSSCRAMIRKTIRDDNELFVQFNSKVLQPNDVQLECLRRLSLERKAGEKKGLVVLPTGLGKTLLSIWDSKSVGTPILYVVHNNEILRQVRESFERVFSGCTMGFLNTYERKHAEVDVLFANISSISDPKNYKQFTRSHFRYIIIDEFHHSAAKSYLEVIEYFEPEYLLGLTATPERTDQKSILRLVDNNLVFLMDTEDAISQGYLVPFHYIGLQDNIDYSDIRHNGYRYVVKDLNQHLIIERRDEAIIREVLARAGNRRGLAYCITIEHAERSAEHFAKSGILSVAIHSGLDKDVRDRRIEDFKNGLYRLAFVVDIFNEGVDYPEVDLLLFMRPTESRIILTQQLGRGLRVCPGKTNVLALDFIGDFIGAERIPDYIKGAYFMHQEFSENLDKPILYYDCGIVVEFSSEVAAMMYSRTTKISLDSELVSDFFDVWGRIRRTPTILSVNIFGKIDPFVYVKTYGNWVNTVERMQRLDEKIVLLDNIDIPEPDIDTTSPERLKKAWKQVSQENEVILKSISVFCSGYFGDSQRKRLKDSFKSMCETTDELLALVEYIMTPLAIKKKLFVDSTIHAVDSQKTRERMVVRNIEWFCGKYRDSYVMARSILGFERQLLKFKKRRRLPHPSKLEGFVTDELLQLYSCLISLNKSLSQMKQLHDQAYE